MAPFFPGLFLKGLYKPDAKRRDKFAAEQIFLYGLALSKRTEIPINNFVCAYFDDKNYFQFSP